MEGVRVYLQDILMRSLGTYELTHPNSFWPLPLLQGDVCFGYRTLAFRCPAIEQAMLA